MSFRVIVAAAIFSISVVSAIAQEDAKKKGIELYRQSKDSEAISVLENVSKQSAFKKDAEVWNYLGMAYLNKGENKKARKALEKAVGFKPESSPYRTNLAYAYLFNRQVNKAQSEIEKAIELDVNNVTAYYISGSANLWEGKFDKAQADADKVIALDAAYPQGYVLKSNVLVARLGDRVTAGSTVKDEIGLLKEAVDTLTAGVTNCKSSPNVKTVESEAESIGAFYRFFSKDRTTTIATEATAPDPGVTKGKNNLEAKSRLHGSCETGGHLRPRKIGRLAGRRREGSTYPCVKTIGLRS